MCTQIPTSQTLCFQSNIKNEAIANASNVWDIRIVQV